MAKLNNVDVPIARTSPKRKQDLSCEHQTTMNFMQIQPVCYRHTLKGEDLMLSSLATVRPAPMTTPCFGRMRLNTRCFFVPFYQVFPQWSRFYYDVIGSDFNSSSLVVGSPYFLNNSIVNYFKSWSVIGDDGTSHPLSFSDPAFTSDDSDFNVDGLVWYQLSVEGRRRIKVLEALGYEINWASKDATELSALPLLCYAKVYLDWFANQSYLDSSQVLRLQQLLNYQNPITALQLTISDISLLLDLVTCVCYDNDNYFNSAWDNPQSPINTQFSSLSFNDFTTPDLGILGNVITAGFTSGTPIMKQTDFDEPYIGTQYLHNALRKLSDFQKRHQLSGASVIDRALAQAGFVSLKDKVDRSIYIGGTSIDINVGDIYSTADTAGASVGDYAGRGFGQGRQSWSFTTDEMGLFLVVASIIPDANIVFGMDRNNLHLEKTQFFQDEFDSLGVQAIAKREVYVSRNGNFAADIDYDSTFGYSGRYAEYKRPKSWVTGDLRRRSVMSGGLNWTLVRNFDDSTFNDDVENVHHSLDFTRGKDWRQYNRIFNEMNDKSDKFIVDFHFDFGTMSPCKPMFETYDFEDETKKITLTSNGAKMN